MQDKNFEYKENETVVKPVVESVEYQWGEEYLVFEGNYQQLLQHVKNCESVELSFDNNHRKKENDILYNDGFKKVVFNNLDESTWDWNKFVSDFIHIKCLCVRDCSEVSELIFDLKSLVRLELNTCNLEKFCFDDIINITKLGSLDLSFSMIKVIPEIIGELVFLKKLFLLSTDIKELPSSIKKLKNLEYLNMDRTKINQVPEVIGKLTSLKKLSFMSTNVRGLPNSIKKLQNLEYLGLNGTKILQIPTVIGTLKNLTDLYLGQTDIKVFPIEMQNLSKLEHLALWETQLELLPEWICSYKNLKGLYLGRDTGIRKLPERIGDLTNLEELYLDGTGINELPKSFGKLVNLKKLNLNRTKVHRFPSLEAMNHLSICDLSYMVLERIPKEFINSKIYFKSNTYEKGLRLEHTKLLCQPISLFSHDKEFINAYYDEEKIHLNETKIVFLGDGEAGKSHIIKRIMKDNQILSHFKEESTPGIAISQKLCIVDQENIRLQIWDFGGQEIMHSMHRFFLTDRTLYVIVINARDNTQDERAEYWLNNVKNFANGCPVIMVLNKMDQNPTASINERLLRDDYPQIIQILKMSALRDSSEVFGQLMDQIVASVKSFDSYAMDFPLSWNKIKTTLEEMRENYIIDSKYREICKQNAVDDEQIQNWLLDWFHDLGISFNYYKQDQLLGGYMVLKPAWITNAIYIILFNGNQYAENGLIRVSGIVDLLKDPPKSVENIKYKIEEVPYILGVMRRFEISYAVDEKNEFIPMMCDKNQHKDAEMFVGNDSMEYYMEYEYLPNNVLHKLMIKMQHDFDKDKIWLTGMILHSRGNNISALVRMHDKRIEIFIRSSDCTVHPPKEYLSEIRENLININKELNLEAKDTIVYKEGIKSENIHYDMLLIYLSAGQYEYFSPVFRKLIPIRKILGMVENEIDIDLIMQYCKENEDEKLSYQLINHMLIKQHTEIHYDQLEKDILKCCLKLQGFSLLILQGKENDRNTYLRDLLSSNDRYRVSDQTLNGTSSNQKAAGELDLLISKINGIPFSIIEAMTLSSVSKKYISEHIDKLFLYDTWGLENNYILVYVENSNFVAFKNRYQKFISQYEYPVMYLGIEERNSYAEMAIFDVTLLRNEQERKITHILVHLQEISN